jgi:CubicO group peptidase (beta-lactamase class C family)
MLPSPGSVAGRGAAILMVAAAVAACDTPRGMGQATPDAVVSAAEPRAMRAHVLALDPARPRTNALDSALLARALAQADSLDRLRCLVVARHGEILAERCARGFRPDRYANVKSVSKSVLSALVGIAIAEGHLGGVDEPVLPLLERRLDGEPDPRKGAITLGHLLSMQSGLESTSGRNYGGWVSSRDWVRDAFDRPLVAEPGGRRLYSTGNYHLVSAILTDATGRSTLAYARSRLAEPLGISIPGWPTDPQGIYFGGNDMRLTPRAMIRFGELYRTGGRHDGREAVPEPWIRASLEPRAQSRWSGDGYGYGWFLARAGRYPMFYARGYGGQFIFVVPDLELTVATTADPNVARGRGPTREIHRLLGDWLVPAAERGAGEAVAEAAEH